MCSSDLAWPGRWADDQRGLSVPPWEEPPDVGQSECSDVRCRWHEQRLPSERAVPKQQSVFVGRRLELSRPARVVRAAAARVGEPATDLHVVDVDERRIDPTNIMGDWGRSDDDQRHRIVLNGTVSSSMAPATTAVGDPRAFQFGVRLTF